MSKRAITMLMAIVLIGAAGGPAGAGRFELLSRSLLQGPSRCGSFFGEGFILGTGGGIVLFENTADPGEGKQIFIPIEGEPMDIVVRGPAAYIAAKAGGLVTVDLTDPSAPKVKTSFAKSRRAICCVMSGETLILVDIDYALYLFDVADPLEPAARGTEKLPFAPLWAAAENELITVIFSRKALVYTATPEGGIEKRSEFAFPDNMKSGVIHDRILYAVTLDGGVLRWDLRSPEQPVSLGTLKADRIADLAFSGSRGFALTKSQSVVPIEIDNPYAAEVVTGRPLRLAGVDEEQKKGGAIARIRQSLTHGMIPGSSLELDGDRMASIAGKSGVSFFTLEGITARFTGTMPTPGFAVDLAADGDLLYVANSHDGLRIGEVHGDGSVEWIGHLQTTEARDVAVDGSLLALCDGGGGFKTIDVADPRNPRIVGARKSPFYNSALVIRDRRAYIAGGLGGVEVLDFTDAADPKLVWRDEFSEVRGIDVDARYLYFADGFEGFRIFSLAGGKPQSVSRLDTEGWNCDCFVLGDFAYLADGGNGLKVVDIADRAAPALLGAVEIGAITRNLHAVGHMVFAAAQVGGIAAIDVTNPAAPTIAARYRTVDDGRGVYADGRFVYLASGSGGVYIFRFER